MKVTLVRDWMMLGVEGQWGHVAIRDAAGLDRVEETLFNEIPHTSAAAVLLRETFMVAKSRPAARRVLGDQDGRRQLSRTTFSTDVSTSNGFLWVLYYDRS